MINPRRFELALSAGLVPLIVLAIFSMLTPSTALGLGGHPGSPGFRMSASALSIDRMALRGASVEGVGTAHFDIGRLNRSVDMVIERDFNPGGLVPGGGVYTVGVYVPVAVSNNVDIFTQRACVRGVGIAGFGFLTGLLDGWLNSSISNGFRPSLLTGLLNLIGPSGFVGFTVNRMWGETVRLNAGQLAAARGMVIRVTRQTTSPQFAGGCV